MALNVHTESALTGNKLDDRVALVLTYDEPGHEGLVRRYTDVVSAALMIAYIFKVSGTRYAWRILSDDESRAYRAERMALLLGDGI